MDLFQYEILQRAIIAGVLIGLISPLIGLFVVLRRLSLLGDTIAHVSIAGVALGLLIDIYPLGLGFLFAIFAAFAIEMFRKYYQSYAELSIAIIMSGGIAVASILFTLGKGYNINVQTYLFGSIFTVSMQEIWIILAFSVIIVLFVFLFYKELFLITFDEDAAAVGGLPVRAINFVNTILTAFVVSAAIKVVGALLVSALITIPAAAGIALRKGFKTTLFWTVIISEFAIVTGLLISWEWNLAPNGTIVLLLIGILLSIMIGFKKART
ncbi:metal ABC transporter permease [Longirhabdus pacifica]|uniref:metal ABC transporter permease n=1 Tax=Longirhabdus pacifica TaxID=2305227 RepID=UPI001008C6B7|nr:metal ABC transporter permease [Longirhabdus pacifica]